MLRTLATFVVLAFDAGCDTPLEPTDAGPLLAVDEILHQTGDALQARLGEPDIVLTRSETVTTLQWKDADGDQTWVYVDLLNDEASYVAYTFKTMDPFDTAAALRRIGLSVPQQEPEHVWENGAKRWKPFGQYHRLVVNPVTKLVVVSLLPEFP